MGLGLGVGVRGRARVRVSVKVRAALRHHAASASLISTASARKRPLVPSLKPSSCAW